MANCPGKLVAKCLCKLASCIKSIWHLVSPSYDSKVSIYTLNYLCTWLATLAMPSSWACLRQYFVTLLREALRLMLAMFTKFFVQCTVYSVKLYITIFNNYFWAIAYSRFHSIWKVPQNELIVTQILVIKAYQWRMWLYNYVLFNFSEEAYYL